MSLFLMCVLFNVAIGAEDYSAHIVGLMVPRHPFGKTFFAVPVVAWFSECLDSFLQDFGESLSVVVNLEVPR